jgi:hypothetical protein
MTTKNWQRTNNYHRCANTMASPHLQDTDEIMSSVVAEGQSSAPGFAMASDLPNPAQGQAASAVALSTTIDEDDDEDDEEDGDDENPTVDTKPQSGMTFGIDGSKPVSLLNGSFGISMSTSSPSIVHKTEVSPLEPYCPDEEKATSGTESSSAESTYVNFGLVTWEKNREQWLSRTAAAASASAAGDSTTNGTDTATIPEHAPERHAIPINVDAIIDAVFSTPQKMRLSGGIGEKFPQSVPLPQMVDILQDLWEAESL